jgi:hypothetical protein
MEEADGKKIQVSVTVSGNGSTTVNNVTVEAGGQLIINCGVHSEESSETPKEESAPPKTYEEWRLNLLKTSEAESPDLPARRDAALASFLSSLSDQDKVRELVDSILLCKTANDVAIAVSRFNLECHQVTSKLFVEGISAFVSFKDGSSDSNLRRCLRSVHLSLPTHKK